MKKNRYYVLGSKNGRGMRSTNTVYLVFGGIIVFLIAYPFVAISLRYQTGYIFAKAFDFIGTVCLTVGGFFTALSILNVFFGGRSLNLKMLTTGIVFLWIGCWITGSVLNIFGITIGSENTSPGYH